MSEERQMDIAERHIRKQERDRDEAIRIAHALLALIREGQHTPGLHDTSVNRMQCRFDVAKRDHLEVELERLERGTT